MPKQIDIDTPAVDKRNQLNVRIDDDDVQRIDQKRIALQAALGRIPTRSEILRLALNQFLGTTKTKRQTKP